MNGSWQNKAYLLPQSHTHLQNLSPLVLKGQQETRPSTTGDLPLLHHRCERSARSRPSQPASQQDKKEQGSCSKDNGLNHLKQLNYLYITHPVASSTLISPQHSTHCTLHSIHSTWTNKFLQSTSNPVFSTSPSMLPMNEIFRGNNYIFQKY